MESLPTQGQPANNHRSRPTTGSPNMIRGVVRQEDGDLAGSMIPLKGSQATAADEASSFRQGGKRPRTTSSIFAAAATGMLTGRVTPVAVATAPSFAKQEQAVQYEQQPDALFRLHGHLGSGRVSAPAASDSSKAGCDTKRVISGGTVATEATVTAAVAAVFQTNAADCMTLHESSYREEALGEAAAMAADERRSSPPNPLPEVSVGYHRDKYDHPEGAWSPAVLFDSRTQEHTNGCFVEAGAVVSSSLFVDGRRHGPSSPPAPAYEPSPLNEDNATASGSWHGPERNLNEMARGGPEETQLQRHGSAAAHAKGGDLELAKANGFSSEGTNFSSPRYQTVERKVRVKVEGGRHRFIQSPQRRVPAMSSLDGERPPSPTVDRQDFLSTMKKSDDAYQSVREDLIHYMEGVRARTSEDGTPSVTFPRNFDRIVGLMGRSELEDQPLDEETKNSSRSGRLRRSPGGGRKDGGKGQGKGAGLGDRVPPWTKYLLEEGLDRTKAFSRYRGMFADEETGEDRVMRGLAKMRELDLRLARTTARARELTVMARHAAEQAARAASGVTTENERTSPRHHQGRGPVAVEDTTTNHPRVRLPLPLVSEPVPFGAISSRVSNGSARQKENGGGDGTGLRTERSEMSAASESQLGAGGASGSSKDGQARGGRAFVTQNFRGAGRKGSSSNTRSASVSVDGSENLTSTPTASGGRRRKSKFGGPGDGSSRGGTSSGGGGGVCASSSGSGCGGSGGSSGVSFVLKNKRHAARASRRRLTDEQESLVSRFLQDPNGFNDKGEPTGEEPSGVWAEIAPYGGAGATDDAARLAEINAKILAIGGVVLPDRQEEQEEDNAVQERDQRLSRPTAAASEPSGVQNGDQGRISSPPPPPPPRPPSSRSRGITGAATAGAAMARDPTAPGEATLREQREKREIRYRERAIDNALEQLRDSLFQDSAAGGRGLREKAVDTALELARSAPLDLQGGVRRGAGRIDSLLGGDGPQPVGEWEVKHALRQGEEELRAKDLASREKIEELLATVRQQSAAASRCTGLLQRRDEMVASDWVPQGTTLDGFFSLDGAALADTEDGGDIPPGKSGSSWSNAATAETSSPSSFANRGRSTSAAGTAFKLQQQADVMLGSKAPLVRGSRSTQREQPSRREEKTEATKTATSTTADAEGPSSAPRPRPRLPRNKQPSAIPPELSALFHAPLLVPRRLDPPVAGIAAAAVAAGGTNRMKSGTGVVS